MASRRKFLGLLGISAVAAPIAAKSALDKSIGEQAGISGLGAPGHFSVGSIGRLPEAQQNCGSLGSIIPYDETIQQSVGYIKTFGLPDFFEKQLRHQSKWVSFLDPDLAAKRSWSMSIKIQEQRARNYQQLLNSCESEAWSLKRKSLLKSILGFNWPW